MLLYYQQLYSFRSKRFERTDMVILFWLIFLTIFMAVSPQNSNTGNQSTWMSNHDCTFNYATTISNFTFYNCTTKTGNYSTWYLCTIKCCNGLRDIDYRQPSIKALNQCKENMVNEGSSVPIIIMGILVALFGVIVFICFCSVTCRLIRSMRSTNHIGPANDQIDSVQWNEEIQLNNKIEELVWSSKFQKHKRLEIIDTPCSICLEDNTTAELYCKHQYHPICIGSWLRKSDVCPFCRRDNIRGIKVYCQQCRIRYLTCTRTLMCRDGDKIPSICESCLNSRQKIKQDVELPISRDFIFDHEASHEKIIQKDGDYMFSVQNIQ